MIRIKTIQTRDCYYPQHYPIYRETLNSAAYNPYEFEEGYYFFDKEMECNTLSSPSCYIGPYPTIDFVIEAQYKHHIAIMAL